MSNKSAGPQWTLRLLTCLLLVSSFLFTPTRFLFASAKDTKEFILDEINNRDFETNWDKPIVGFGDDLNAAQREQTFTALGVDKKEDFQFLKINNNDVEKYTNETNIFSSVVSSVVLKKAPKGSGVQVYINTPERIKLVRDFEYSNAAITSGVKDCIIVVAAVSDATGNGALAGVYKIFELIEPNSINVDAAKLASEELKLSRQLQDSIQAEQKKQEKQEQKDKNITPAPANKEAEEKAKLEQAKKLSQTMINLKKDLAKTKGKVDSKENLEKKITDAFKANGFPMTDVMLNKLLRWAQSFQGLQVNWDDMLKQLDQFDKKKVIDKSGEKFDIKKATFGLSWKILLPLILFVIALIVLIIVLVSKKNKSGKNPGPVGPGPQNPNNQMPGQAFGQNQPPYNPSVQNSNNNYQAAGPFPNQYNAQPPMQNPNQGDPMSGQFSNPMPNPFSNPMPNQWNNQPVNQAPYQAPAPYPNQTPNPYNQTPNPGQNQFPTGNSNPGPGYPSANPYAGGDNPLPNPPSDENPDSFHK